MRSPSQLQFHHFGPSSYIKASLVTQMIKNLPAIQETQFRSMGWEDALEKGMATHSSVLAWTILQTEESGGLQSMELQRDTTERLTLSLSDIKIPSTVISNSPGRGSYSLNLDFRVTFYIYKKAICLVFFFFIFFKLPT